MPRESLLLSFIKPDGRLPPQTELENMTPTTQCRGGATCTEDRAEVQNYNETPCTVDCRITGWTDWSGCSETCGDGVEYKDPTIGDQAQHGGEACPAAQERVCNPCASPPPTTTTTPASAPAPVGCVAHIATCTRSPLP